MFFNIFPVIGEALPGHLECSPAAWVLILQFTLKGKPNFLTTNLSKLKLMNFITPKTEVAYLKKHGRYRDLKFRAAHLRDISKRPIWVIFVRMGYPLLIMHGYLIYFYSCVK